MGAIKIAIEEINLLIVEDNPKKVEKILNKLSGLVHKLRLSGIGGINEYSREKVHRKESSINTYPQNITVSEIEEPNLMSD